MPVRGGCHNLEYPPHLLELVGILVLDVHDGDGKASLLAEARSGTDRLWPELGGLPFFNRPNTPCRDEPNTWQVDAWVAALALPSSAEVTKYKNIPQIGWPPPY